jgi:hypothetical protein
MAFLSWGDLNDAQAHLNEALRIYDPERDREAKFRFSAIPAQRQHPTSRRQNGIWARSIKQSS